MLAMPSACAAEGMLPARKQVACSRLVLAAEHAGTRAALITPCPVGRREDREGGFATKSGSTETVETWTGTVAVPKGELGVEA